MKRFALLIIVAISAIPSFSFGQVKNKEKLVQFSAASRPKNLSDSALLDIVQKQTFRYFWDFAHPVSGLARERSNMGNDYGLETTTTGGTGFGIMAMLVAVERGWITRDTAVGHLLKIIRFLRKADKYHGVFPHWLNGETGRTVPFYPVYNCVNIITQRCFSRSSICKILSRC